MGGGGGERELARILLSPRYSCESTHLLQIAMSTSVPSSLQHHSQH